MRRGYPEKSTLRFKLALSGACLSTLPIIGWVTDTTWLVRVSETHPAIVMPTALAFLLCFSALVLFARGQAEKVQTVLLIAVVALLVGNWAYADLHQLPVLLGFARHIPAPGDAMSAATTIGLLLAVLALLELRKRPYSAWALSMAVFGLSSTVAILLGHSFEPSSIYALPPLASMSEYTGGLFALLFLALLMPEAEAELTPPL